MKEAYESYQVWVDGIVTHTWEPLKKEEHFKSHIVYVGSKKKREAAVKLAKRQAEMTYSNRHPNMTYVVVVIGVKERKPEDSSSQFVELETFAAK